MNFSFPRFFCALLVLPVFSSLAASSSAAASPSTSSQESIDTAHVMEVASRKFSAFDAANHGETNYPTDAKGATWRCVGSNDWVAGFYPGCLWYLYEYAKEKSLPDAPHLRAMAEAWTKGLTQQQYNTGSHDIGFVIFDSFGNGYRLTESHSYPPVINQAAQSLAQRFVPKTSLIRSWGQIGDEKNQSSIIDNMMNLELLLWSSNHGGKTIHGTSEDLMKIAKSHADRVIDLWFRPDGSVYHVVEVDPLTGKVIKKHTAQGKSDESAWARGQAWAMDGFATMYQYTKDPRYLKASERATDYYLNHLPTDFVPPSDFNSTLKGLEFKDSSAAAVAACAMLKLSHLTKDPTLKKKYFNDAEKTLQALTHAPYFAKGDDKASILNYAARNYCEDPNNPLTNTSLIFGDYYLLEALLAYEREKPKASMTAQHNASL